MTAFPLFGRYSARTFCGPASLAVFDAAIARYVAKDLPPAAQAAGRVGAWVDRESWREVITAMDRADTNLARCDDRWLELRAAYLEMMAANASRSGLRFERWGESIAAACRYHGPDSDLVARMRTASKEDARSSTKGQARRLEKAIRRRHDARDARHRRSPLRVRECPAGRELPRAVHGRPGRRRPDRSGRGGRHGGYATTSTAPSSTEARLSRASGAGHRRGRQPGRGTGRLRPARVGPERCACRQMRPCRSSAVGG